MVKVFLEAYGVLFVLTQYVFRHCTSLVCTEYGGQCSYGVVHVFDNTPLIMLLDKLNRHAISPMEDIMDIIHITSKGKMMDMLERLYIYKETESNNQINDKLTVKANPIFETIVQEDPYRGHSGSS
jgi:hypothetical protein